MEWEENSDNFVIKRDNKEIRFENNRYILNNKEIIATRISNESSYDLIPLDIITQVFSIRGEWLDNTTINIVDPLTQPFYQIFSEVHSIDKINQVCLYDLDSDGKYEMYVAYLMINLFIWLL